MTAIGINATAFAAGAGSFVSVTMSQVAVNKGANFENVFSDKLKNASQVKDEDRTVTTINLKKTEYSKEQPDTQQPEEANVSKAPEENPKAESTVETDGDNTAKEEVKTGEEQKVLTDGKEEIISDEELNTIFEILNTLMQGIADILETSLRELQGSFEELNILPKDLVNTNKMADLVLNMNEGAELSDMLVDQDMLNMFNEIKDLVQEVLSDFGYTETEFSEITSEPMFTEPEEVLKLLDDKGFFKPVIKNAADEEAVPETDAEPVTDEQTPDFKVQVVKTDSDNTGNEQFGGTDTDDNQSTPIRHEERSNSVTPAESFVRGIENAVKTLDIDMPVAEGQVTVRDIVYQLVDAVKVEINPENTSLEMNLNPESLGRVNLNITSKNGVMTAQITTENEVSKEALESQLQILKDNIEAQGVRVEAIEVTVSSFIFSDSKNAESNSANEPEQGKRAGKNAINAADSVSDMASEAEELKRKVILESGSTVTYVA